LKFCNWFLDILRQDAVTLSFAARAYCLMPDHVHLLLEGLESDSDLLQLMKTVKTKTSILFARTTGKPLWQKKFYDHILRRNDSPDAVAWYIWMNPVRAGICQRPEQYLFLGSLTGAWPKTLKPFSEWIPPWRNIKAPPKVRGRYTCPN
jgi:putative transposase